jgi:hypothetical protein
MRTRAWFPYLIFGVCSLLYLYPFMRLNLQSADEGTLLYGAVRVTSGQVPFRDFFEVMGPASFYWLAAFFKLFGTNFLATRISLALTSFSIALLMYFLTRRLTNGYYTIPAVLLMATLFRHLWPESSHHTDSTLFALLSFAALVCWIETNRGLLLCLAGALTGMTTLFLQPKGILLFISFLVLVILLRREAGLLPSLGWLAGGYLTVLTTVVLLYWRAGALWDLTYANIVWPLDNYSGVNAVPYGQGLWEYWESLNKGIDSVCSLVIGASVAGLLTFPNLIIASLPVILILFALWYRRLAFDRRTLPYWVVGTALWLSELHRKDIVHLIYGSPLLIILFFHFLARERHRLARHALQLICIETVALAAVNLFLTRYATTELVTPRGSFYAFRPDPVLDFLDTHVKSGEDIFVYPYGPTYYFLSGAENPTRFSILLYHMNTDAQFREAVRSLHEKRVRYVIWDRMPGIFENFPAYSAPSKERLIMEPYLTEQYHLLKSIDGVDVLERNSERNSEPIETSRQTREQLLDINAMGHFTSSRPATRETVP